MFKKGDFVRVKPGTKLDNGEVADNWGGEVYYVDKQEGTCGVAIDAPSLDAISDAYLMYAFKKRKQTVEYFFKPEVLEHGPSRSTEEETMAAIDRLVEREVKIEKIIEQQWYAERDSWRAGFRDSRFFEPLADIESADIDTVLNTFPEYLYHYEGVLPEEWEPAHVQAVCLKWAPSQITAEADDFKDYGTVAMAFLAYLGDAGHIDNAAELIKAVDEVKDQIPVEAAKESNWGMAKSTMMSALAQGYDPSSGEDVHTFLARQFTQEPAHQQPTYQQPTTPPEDPFKGIGRNQKITVQYADGTVKADIKFKKVEKDLRAGRCELLK